MDHYSNLIAPSLKIASKKLHRFMIRMFKSCNLKTKSIISISKMINK